MAETTPTNCLFLGDCVEVLGKSIPNSSIDMVLFSPPYDEMRDYNGFSLDLGALGEEIFRVLKDGGVAVCVINDGTKNFAKSLTTCRLTLDWVDRVGFKLFEQMIYSRHGRPGAWWNKRFRVDHEYILVFFKGARPNYFDKEHLAVAAKYAGEEWHGTDRQTSGDLAEVEKGRYLKPTKCRGTIWPYSASNSEGNRLKLEHPATYPDQLASDLIRCFSPENGIVLDPTCGSGTTCVAAAQYGRMYIGVDLSADYLEIARARLSREVRESIL